MFSDTRLLHSSQSITMKGAVRVTGGGPGKDLAANASLYTCLVMDMPLERLKLRWVVAWLGGLLAKWWQLSQGGGAGGVEETCMPACAELVACRWSPASVSCLPSPCRRIGVFPVLWRHMQQEPTQSLSRASTLALAVGTPGLAGGPGEDIEAALEDLERGPSPPDSARCGAGAVAVLQVLATLLCC